MRFDRKMQGKWCGQKQLIVYLLIRRGFSFSFNWLLSETVHVFYLDGCISTYNRMDKFCVILSLLSTEKKAT